MDKKLEEAKKDKKSIVITIGGGCLRDVYNLPEGYTYTLIDFDDLAEEDEEESIEVLNEKEPFETDAEYKERMKKEPEYLKVKEEHA